MGYVESQLQLYGHSDTKKPQKDLIEEALRLKVKAWAEGENEKQEESEEDDDDFDPEHSPFSGKLTAVLWKDSRYRANTYDGLNERGGPNSVFKVDENTVKKAYKTSPGLPKLFKDLYKFGGMACNFNYNAKYQGSEVKATKNSSNKRGYSAKKQKSSAGKMARCSMPYEWNAHHMIPGNAFYSELIVAGKPVKIFSQEQFYLMLMSDYNVNAGGNMIPLPTSGMDFFQPVHQMLLHPSDHKKYTAEVQKRLKEIAKELDGLKGDASKPHPNVSVDIKDDLEEVQDYCWDLLHELGKEDCQARLKGVNPNFGSHSDLVQEGKLK